MNDTNVAASRAIHSRLRAISEAIVERQYARCPELRDRYGERGREKCVADTEFHLAHLSGALLASSPPLFADYIGWVSGVLTVANIRPDDVRDNLICLRDVLGEQLPERMAAVAVGYVEATLGRLAGPQPEAPSHLPAAGPLAGEYLNLVLGFERHAAGRLVLGAVDSGMSIRDVYLQVLQPCQRELGRLWQAGRITVAQEHYGTAATQLVMSQLAPRLFAAERNGRRAVIACVAGEAHEVGPRMVADLLELAGWDTIYLGASVPIGGVVRAVAEHRADLLAVSATMTYHLPAVIDLIAAVRSEPACTAVKVLVGGRPFDAEPGLWRRVGSDGHADDAEQACRLADRLMDSQADAVVRVEQRVSGLSPEVALPAPPRLPDDVYEELGRVNSEVVALNRELARKGAEAERLHAQVSRQAADLAQADRRKNEFLALLGHELRNPLASVRNALALLGPDDPDPETVRWARDLMGRQVRQMVRLVDDLLDLSRIMQGKLTLRRERVELAAVVADAVETARPAIDSRRHELTVSLPGEPVALDADPIRLAQALTNLLNNAAKYSEPGGRIALAARREGPDVVLGVRDSGLGIAPEMLPRIFDLFMQEGRSSEWSQGGLGVGLALVKRLVEMHGGIVEARSEGLGRGSEFVVRLPASAAGLELEPQSGGERTGAAWPRRRILVVDDNVDAASALGRMLARLYGQEVQVAHDGPSALAAAQGYRPDVILLDIGLPGMDGYEVARRLRGRPEFGGTLIVALTGWGQESDRQRSKEAGFDRHLVKPVEPEDLQKLLAEVVR